MEKSFRAKSKSKISLSSRSPQADTTDTLRDGDISSMRKIFTSTNCETTGRLLYDHSLYDKDKVAWTIFLIFYHSKKKKSNILKNAKYFCEYWIYTLLIFWKLEAILKGSNSKMSFSNVPVRNPGRYFEQFVKVVQPITGGGQSYMSAAANTPSMAVTTNNFIAGEGSGQSQGSFVAAAGSLGSQSNQFGSFGGSQNQGYQFK